MLSSVDKEVKFQVSVGVAVGALSVTVRGHWAGESREVVLQWPRSVVVHVEPLA